MSEYKQKLSPLTAISPLDGRYYNQVHLALSPYFSEAALIQARLEIEIEYLIFLRQTNFEPLLNFPPTNEELRRCYNSELLTIDELHKIKSLEQTTRHDVKAVEYYLKDLLSVHPPSRPYLEWIHFGLTSQDINHLALPLLLKRFHHQQYLPALEQLQTELAKLAGEWHQLPMLSRTHGQPASPTTLGKELTVFLNRLSDQRHLLAQIPFRAKFGGAVGNFNAHTAAFPDIDWPHLADDFVSQHFGLERTKVTTQIEPYDHLAAYCDNLRRINVILIDFCRDIWTYISQDYFKCKIIGGEVGSSTMPHKVNPIDFENAEGNLGLANALLNHFSNKLPISRLQRDLTDSTVTRNLGVALGHIYLAFNSIQRGIKRLDLNELAIKNDLKSNWIVVAEGLQTILRREGYPKSYEALKDLTRTPNPPGPIEISNWIDQLDSQLITPQIKAELKKLTPFNYLGQALS